MLIPCFEEVLTIAKAHLAKTDYHIAYVDDVLSLVKPKVKPFAIDFLSGKNQHRRLYPTQAEVILKATLAKTVGIQIFDLTAGLGRDAFLMANAGANVSMFERHPVVFVLLADALKRLSLHLPEIAANLSLTYLDANTLSIKARPDVVYLDPMHPPRKSKAAVKQDIRLVQSIVGEDIDKEKLFNLALRLAEKRVVVKWPVKVPSISLQKANFTYSGKSTNFEVYLT